MKRALKIWPWNCWLDEAQTKSELLFGGLKETVSSHKLIRGKSPDRVRDEYGMDFGDIVNELGIKLLLDGKIKRRRHLGLGDEKIARRIITILKLLLIDLYRRRRREKARFINTSFTLNAEKTAVFEDFFIRHLSDLRYSPEGLCILEDLNRVAGSLTPRQQAIFNAVQRFDQGELSVKDLVKYLGYEKSVIYKEIREIFTKLARAFGFSC